jgi:hypothetical protein
MEFLQETLSIEFEISMFYYHTTTDFRNDFTLKHSLMVVEM